MRRAMVVAGGFGVTNAFVAAVLLALIPRPSHSTGWFAYAPLAEKVPRGDVAQMDWALVAIPAALVVLNFLLVVVAARRRWLAP